MSTHTTSGDVHGHHLDFFRSAKIWLVRSGGNVVGPVSIDLIERGLAAGKIPTDAEMAHVDRNEWFAVARYEAPAELRQAPPPPPSFRYPEEPVSIPTQGVLESLFG